jgi:WD40 repeat protein
MRMADENAQAPRDVASQRPPEADPHSVPSPVPAALEQTLSSRYETLRLAWQRIFGYDFFISYAWADGRPYAEALGRGLSAPPHRFRYFIDQKEMGGGEAWRASVRKALRRSSVMILVASSAALERDNVFEEIETFSARDRPLIPIEVGTQISALAATHRARPYLEERLRFEEQDGPTRLVRGEPSPDVLNFLGKSFGFVRVGRLRSLVLVTLVSVFAGLAVWAGFSFLAEREARQLAQLQEARAVSALARRETERGDAMTGMLAILRVMPDTAKQDPRPHSPPAEMALLDAWLRNREVMAMIGHTEQVTSASFSRDGKRVVTASDDSTARVWDLSGPTPVSTVLAGHTDKVRSASFSPDGKRVVTASSDNTARVWDLSGPTPVSTELAGHTDPVSSASFSPDGKRVVTASSDNTARVWDLSGPRPVSTVLAGHTSTVSSASFSPDGKRVVTASYDNTARVWDLRSKPVSTVLAGHTNWVRSASFSPDGKRVVTASDDNTARVWDLSGPRPVSTVLAGHTSTVSGASFSRDGKRVVTASWDNTARVWDLRSKPGFTVLAGHTGPVTSASFSPDGKRVVTASSDNTARV